MSTIHAYPLTDPSTAAHAQALSLLRPHLPTSLPLYRRIQQGRFFASTALLANLDSLARAEPSPGEPWLLALVDRASRPETEVWMFGSWESSSLSSCPPSAVQDEVLRNLVWKIRSFPLPASIHRQERLEKLHKDSSSNDTDHSGTSRADYAAHRFDANIMLFGAVHESTAKCLERLGVVKHVFENSAHFIPNHTYVFDRKDLPPLPTSLPSGFRWGELDQRHFPLVRSRTMIPRQDRTLAVLRSLAIFPNDSDQQPIAWAFIQLDGSLSTLHVEPEWRGRGLAKMISTKLLVEKMPALWEKGVTEWAHAYVIEGNRASCRVCEAVGGRREWDAYWVRVDLGAT
ncbi:acetyltransferase like [Lecanosticta acicola]|uniref:Acetyltransferase like n=1 Tax=Lecanosticta acicola TaxID=111012 RepID=A0AAI9ECH3_9PEZI|nr:acetyltransferase like [Lecanosticta acicola]